MPDLLVNIDVDDLEKAIAFYCEAFGLRIGRRFGSGAMELLGSSAPIYLLVKPAGSPTSPATEQRRNYFRHWTPVHLDFVVDNLDESVVRAVRAGAKLEGGIESFSWGRLATFSDPFGHGFCLLQLVGAGYDEAA